MLSISEDTICALSTAPGVGAIALIRVSGKNTFDIVSELFSKSITNKASHSVHFGTIRNSSKEIIDEVLVTILHEGKSFTGEATAEIACHGSTFIQREILNLLLKHGCRMAEPGEFTMRAFFNGKMDLSQAEAIADLIASNSKKVHQIAMNQMRGGYSDIIQQLKQQLIDFASLIELELDFSEEDVEFASRDQLFILVKELQKKLQKLVESFALGNALKNGVNTVIAGRPNAGKSTLLNTLLQEERAIVSAIAGTTRDVITEQLTIDGIAFRLTDTAGIREAVDEIEKIGVERTIQEIEKSNILVYLYDAAQLQIEEVEQDIAQLSNAAIPLVVVANKLDIVDEVKKPQFNGEFITISAKNDTGIDALKKTLVDLVQRDYNEYDTIVVNARHYEAFSKALIDLEKVQQSLEMQIPGDLLAMDIRSAIRHLSAITGEISTDDLLGNIFANFCIGK